MQKKDLSTHRVGTIYLSKYWNYQIGLILLLISNICFYTENTIPIYIITSGVSFVFIIFWGKNLSLKELRMDPFVRWILVLYLMYTIYGCFFLRAEEYNYDIILYTGISNFAIYLSIYEILKSDKNIDLLRAPIIFVSIFCVAYMYITSNGMIGEKEVRIGEALSGNVNTVAISLGILSFFISYFYITNKSKIDLVILFFIIVFMLLTGSKKAIVFIALDFIMLISSSKSKIKKCLIIGLLTIVLFYIVMKVPYFYSVIGHRIQDLLYQVFGVGTASFSNSNDRSSEVRLAMIVDGFDIYFKNPQYYFWGGGEKFFSYRSVFSRYHYSHCNYTEMLCNYGLFGTLLFYVPLIRNLIIINRLKYKNANLALLGIMAVVSLLINSWLVVIYQEICIHYIPATLSFVICKVLKEDSYYVKNQYCS